VKRVSFVVGIVVAIAGTLLFLHFLDTSQAAVLTVQDLLYKRVDVDGDGEYTPADAMFVETQIEVAPQLLEEALKYARISPDGGIDLSPFLRKLGTHDGKITQFVDGRLVTTELK